MKEPEHIPQPDTKLNRAKENVKRELGLGDNFKDGFLFRKNRYGYLIVGSEAAYRFYTKAKLKNRKLEDTEFRAVLKTFFYKVWSEIIKNIYTFKMPWQLGSIYMVDILTSKGEFIDWPKTIKKGSIEKKYNTHTKGKRFRVHWNKHFVRTRNLKFYSFKGAKFSRKEIVQWINECSDDPTKKDYIAHLY